MTVASELPYVPYETEIEIPADKMWNFIGHPAGVVGPEPQQAVCEPKPSRIIPQIIRTGIVLHSRKVYCEAIGLPINGRVFVDVINFETRCKIARLLAIQDMGLFGGHCGLGIRQHSGTLVLHSDGWSVCYYAELPKERTRHNRMSKRFEVPELASLRDRTNETIRALAIVARARLFKENTDVR